MDSTDSPDIPPKKELIFYPLLFSIYPILSIYSANLAIIPSVSLIRPLLAMVGITTLCWSLCWAILRSVSRAAIATTALVGCTFLFTQIQSLAYSIFYSHGYDLWVWVLLTILVTWLATWKFTWHKLANFLCTALIVTTFAQIGVGLTRSASLKPVEQSAIGQSQSTPASRPDIYYVILDGYGRSDALKRALDYDNSEFVNELKKRMFYVASESRANYCQTELSVGSSLNLDYIQAILTKVSPKDNDRAPLGEIINHNAAATYLKEKGYLFAAITTGFPPLQFESADVNMRTRAGFSMIETALIQLTPLAKDTKTLESMYVQRRDHILSAFEAIKSLKVKSLQPRFVVIHILAPHPPFVFGPNGEMIDHKGGFGFWDGSDYLDHVGSASEYRNGYVGQAKYIEAQLLKSIDTVLSGSGEKPLIIVQGDHGSKLRLDQNSLEKTDLNECFPNLNAYLVPESVRHQLYPSITPVNSFRTIFNVLFNENFELKPDRSWYSTYPLPYAFTDVTDKIVDPSEMANLAISK